MNGLGLRLNSAGQPVVDVSRQTGGGERKRCRNGEQSFDHD